MQAIESQTLILYHTDLRGQWPEEAARALAARLPYVKRLAVAAASERARASLAGVALALRALARATGRAVQPAELVFIPEQKPQLTARRAHEAAAGQADFSIAHSGPFVGCAALGRGRVGFDVEFGHDARLPEWVAREATVKAAGLGVRALSEVELTPAGARCRGEHWHARTLEEFVGAAACVMTSVPVRALEAQRVPLAELFAP